MTTATRTWATPIEKVFTTPQVNYIETQLDFLTQELGLLLNNNKFMGYSKLYSGEQKGNYWNWVTMYSHKPYEDWDEYNNKAKYWRIILTQILNTHKSIKDRTAIAQVVSEFDWEETLIDKIKIELKARKINYTHWELENILNSKKMPMVPTELDAIIDFSQTDKQVITLLKETNEHHIYEAEIGNQKFTMKIDKPAHLHPNIIKFCKPKIQRFKNGEIFIVTPYIIDVSENGEEQKSFKLKSGVTGEFGGDIGKIKPFAGAITFSDGSYTTELTMSVETERLGNKIIGESDLIDALYKKINHIEKLLKGKDDDYLFNHWNDLKDEAWLLCRLRTEHKRLLNWLVARDIVNHCLTYGVNVVKLENLKFVTGLGGKWDYSRLQDCINEVAKLNNIQIKFVDASGTSQTDPFSDVHVKPKSDRTLELFDGDKWDRDYTSALECSRRGEVKRGKKFKKPPKVKKKVIVKSKFRDKNSPTPKRPRKLSNRKKRELLKKKAVTYPNSLNKGVSGKSVVVASSGAGQESDSTALSFGDENHQE